jgi:hypothetical protein
MDIPGSRRLLAWVGALAASAWGKEDSTGMEGNSRLDLWAAPFLEATAANTVIAGYNKWIARFPYGQISPATIRKNLDGGMVWDGDNFAVNQIGHPYQGSLYYSAARHFGHGYPAALAYSAVGSLQWEYFLETERPAINDLITTALGGAMLGEVSYRLAEEILDDRARGGERFLREALATLVNPVHGLNRMLGDSHGRSTRPAKDRGAKRPPILFRAASGGVLDFRSEGTGPMPDNPETPRSGRRVPRATIETLFWYGDEYAARRPFDFFVLNLGLRIVRDPIASVYCRALIANHRLFGSGDDYALLSLGQNFDYINNGDYKVAASGIGGGYSHRFRWGKRWYHLLQAQAGGITLGGASTDFYREGERDYNLGPGAFTTTRAVLGRYETGHLALNVDRYFIYTLSGADGFDSIGIGIFELSKSIYGRFGALLSYTVNDRTARYADHPDQTRLTQEVRASLNYGFN